MPPAPERRIPCTMTEGPPSMSKAFALGIDRGPRGALGARGNDKKQGGPISRVPYPFRGRHHPSRPPVARRIPRGLPADLAKPLRGLASRLSLRTTACFHPLEPGEGRVALRCSALLAARLAVPPPSPEARWALTPPFHPYPAWLSAPPTARAAFAPRGYRQDGPWPGGIFLLRCLSPRRVPAPLGAGLRRGARELPGAALS